MSNAFNRPNEVASGVFEVVLPLPARPSSVKVYLINCGSQWVLVDTGMNTSQSLEVLETALDSVGCRFSDIGLLLITHHHPDHFGASSYLRKRTGAPLYIHAEDAARARRILTIANTPITERPEALAFFRRHGFPIDRYQPEAIRPSWMGTRAYEPLLEPDGFFHDNQLIELGSRKFRIIWTPGHSPGHCMVYLEREEILIAGDHLLPKITPHVGMYPEDKHNPLPRYLESLQKIQDLNARLVLPAHGPAFKNHRDRVNELLEHHRSREEKILSIIKTHPATAFDIAQAVFGSEERPIFHVIAATFETLAHLEMACETGKATRLEDGGKVLFIAQPQAAPISLS